MSMITTVLLDVDNTLLDFNRCAAWSMKKAMTEWGLPCYEQLYATFQTINQKLWHEIEEGTLTKDELYRIRWQMIFDRCGIDADGAAFEGIFLKYLRDAHEPVDGAMELLSYLSEKYTVCIASNAPYEQQLHRLKQAGMLPYIQYLFISEEIGHPKPGRRFFDYCFSQLKTVRPEEVIMIGDSLTADIAGGIEYGIQTCWYNYDGIAVPDFPKADYIVTSLGQIQDIL